MPGTRSLRKTKVIKSRFTEILKSMIGSVDSGNEFFQEEKVGCGQEL